MIPDSFGYKKPSTLAEALSLLAQEGAMPLAGGTDVVVMMREEKLFPSLLVDVKNLPELRGINQTDDGGVFIGASEPLQDVVEHPLIAPYQALVMGGGVVGCYEIRHRATIGGNVCNGSPSADSVPGLQVYEAQVVLVSAQGERTLPIDEFLLGPGKVALNPGELLKGIQLPKPQPNAQSRYYRLSRVKGMDLSGLSAGVYCEGDKNFRIALGAVWPTVARARQAEAILNSNPFSKAVFEQAMAEMLKDIHPRKSSLRAAPEYKKDMVPVLIEQAIIDMLGGDILG